MSQLLQAVKIKPLSILDESILEKNLSIAMHEFFATASKSEMKDIFAHTESVQDLEEF